MQKLAFWPKKTVKSAKASNNFSAKGIIALLISLVFSEFGRLSLANGTDARHMEEHKIRRVLH